jgi:hypothetical protein
MGVERRGEEGKGGRGREGGEGPLLFVLLRAA